MTDEVPDPPSNDAPRPPLEEVPAEVFHALNDALEGTRRAAFLAEAMRTQTMLALWDTVVLDETARGLVAREGGRAERAFAVHLAGLLHVSRNRAVSMLHTAQSLRGLAVSYGLFLTGAFAWASAEAVVRNLGGLTGEARERYDLGAAKLAADLAPQLLDAQLSRLHDALDHDDATDRGAAAHRERGVRARPGAGGAGVLTLTGPETDIAAVYETAHKLAVAAHGVDGETRTVQQLMYDIVLDLLLGGFTVDPANIVRNDNGVFTPATPFQRLGDEPDDDEQGDPADPADAAASTPPVRVPQRKTITAQIVVTVPAATIAGVTDEPGKLTGWGSLPAAEVRRIVASARYWTRAEVDPIDDAILAFDSTERIIPIGLRRLIWARSGTCDEPGCPVGAHRTDIDHVIRVEHGGRTVEINLSALCRGSHQTKDDGYIDVERTPDGNLVWHTNRWGGRFVKNAATTIRHRPADQAEDEPAPWDAAA